MQKKNRDRDWSNVPINQGEGLLTSTGSQEISLEHVLTQRLQRTNSADSADLGPLVSCAVREWISVA